MLKKKLVDGNINVVVNDMLLVDHTSSFVTVEILWLANEKSRVSFDFSCRVFHNKKLQEVLLPFSSFCIIHSHIYKSCIIYSTDKRDTSVLTMATCHLFQPLVLSHCERIIHIWIHIVLMWNVMTTKRVNKKIYSFSRIHKFVSFMESELKRNTNKQCSVTGK